MLVVDNEKGAHEEPKAVENFQYSQVYEISVIIVSNGWLGDRGKGKKPQCVHLEFHFQWELQEQDSFVLAWSFPIFCVFVFLFSVE